MVESPLHDQNVFGFVAERQKPAIGHDAFCRTVIFGDQARGEIDACEIREAELLQSVQTVAAAAEKLDDLGI